MELPIARRDIVGDEIAEDVLPGVCLAHPLSGFADDCAEFDFIIQTLGHPRVDVVEGPGDARRLLVEPELLFGRRNAKSGRLLDVLFVVHPDREIFARSFDRRKQTYTR